MSTGVSTFSMYRRKLSPLSKLSKAKRQLLQHSFNQQQRVVDEFQIHQIIPNQKKIVKSEIPEIPKINTSKFKPREEMKVLVNEVKEKQSEKVIRFEEIKVCVTPNGSRLQRAQNFSEVMDDGITRANSDGNNGFDTYLLNKQLNNDLEQEVNYVPSNKLCIPVRKMYDFSRSINGAPKSKRKVSVILVLICF